MSSERIKELESQIAELESRWPAHSAPPMMFQQLEDLEEELEKELRIRFAEGGESDVTETFWPRRWSRRWPRQWRRPRQRSRAGSHGRRQGGRARRQLRVPQLWSQSASPGGNAMLSDDLPQVWRQDGPLISEER